MPRFDVPHFVAVHAVDGVRPGVYRWPDLDQPVTTGITRDGLAHICVDQGLGGDAAYVVIAAHELESLDARAYREADVVLSRSGATTLAELTVCGRPAILVPYPFAVDDHQTKNAQTLAARGAAVLLPQTELTPDRLHSELASLTDARLTVMAAAAREAGHPEAAQRIATALGELVETRP